MHRLTGNPSKDAATIREAMCEAKIEMLGRLLLCPYAADYLSCWHDLIDYKPRVLRAIELISRYHETLVPQD